MINWTIKFSYEAGKYDTCKIHAFCEPAARILAMVKGREMYTNNKGIIIESIEKSDFDFFNNFKNNFNEK